MVDLKIEEINTKIDHVDYIINILDVDKFYLDDLYNILKSLIEIDKIGDNCLFIQNVESLKTKVNGFEYINEQYCKLGIMYSIPSSKDFLFKDNKLIFIIIKIIKICQQCCENEEINEENIKQIKSFITILKKYKLEYSNLIIKERGI